MTETPTATAGPEPSWINKTAQTPVFSDGQEEAPAIAADTRQLLQRISFEEAGRENAPYIRLTLSQRPQFRYSRKDEMTFILTVAGASLAAAPLGLTHFPPQQFEGITHVLARPSGADIEVVVGVERGFKINAKTQDRDILIQAAMK